MKNDTIHFMGAYVFNNEIFDSWLNKKSDEILSKVDREKISTEEMIILVLKAQTNHFHHMDVDMKKGLSDVNNQFHHVDMDMREQFREVNKRIDSVDNRIDSLESKFEKRFEKIDQRFVQIDQKIDNRFMWMIGITIAMSGGLYIKLFLG